MWRDAGSIERRSCGSDHPECLYQDIVVALDSETLINNGQPSLHARALSALDVQRGDAVTHIGAGTGYYSAILAELTGKHGRVVVYEITPDLASRARQMLNRYGHVSVHDAAVVHKALPMSDVIHVNAGATHPVQGWLDALKPNGRLLIPLTAVDGSGGLLLIRKQDQSAYSAAFVSQAMFIPCAGARDEETAKALLQLTSGDGARNVKSLRLDSDPDDSAWFVAKDWWLSTETARVDKVQSGEL